MEKNIYKYIKLTQTRSQHVREQEQRQQDRRQFVVCSVPNAAPTAPSRRRCLCTSVCLSAPSGRTHLLPSARLSAVLSKTTCLTVCLSACLSVCLESSNIVKIVVLPLLITNHNKSVVLCQEASFAVFFCHSQY